MAAYLKGKFTPTNPDKYVGKVNNIIFRSSWERILLSWLDTNPAILKYNSEGVVIPYIDANDGRPHRYYVDFWCKIGLANGQTKEILIEVKPEAQTLPPKNTPGKKRSRYEMECHTYIKNSCKWAAAREFCAKNGLEFFIVTEKTLKLGKYARYPKVRGKPKRVDYNKQPKKVASNVRK